MTTTTTATTSATTGGAAATIAGTEQIDQAIATLVVAFASDPVIRWLFPDGVRYLDCYPQLAKLSGRPAFAAGTADRAPAGAGTALWVPPGAQLPEEEFGALLHEGIDPDRHAEAFALLEQVQAHHPTPAHWYLPFIGVDPCVQGRGYGSALLRVGLERCDRDGLPAYLEASSERNRALYERHGFEVTAEIRVADSPPLWPMLRPAA
jgi:GNAT superfamily N-acetyltransferase